MTPADITETLRLHALWLRGDAAGKRADLTGATLTVADLTRAYLIDANLTGANLTGANLTVANLDGANLAGANLTGANLTMSTCTGANLTRAYLIDANLTWADLTGADLTGADLTGANLTGAVLTKANITGATMPDRRKWEDYRLDHLAGICTSPEVHARAVAAWGSHEWTSCPMHSALGIDSTTEITDATLRRNVAAWVALYDAGLLQPYTSSHKDTP
jgi:uncharacterized protein YjbI with pentapeptide repeats